MHPEGPSTLDRDTIVRACKKDRIRFLRLQFTDILGTNKNVEVPEGQFEKALDGEITFDGSSIEGFVRIEESDMLLRPDLGTFRTFPWEEPHGRVGRVLCDIALPDGGSFDGCPRTTLRRVTAQAAELGYTAMLGPEAEFFLFQRDPEGAPTTQTHDRGAYFDLTPIDRGEECRRAIVNVLESMGFEVEAAHHEVAPGQHEVDFKYDDALATADKIATLKLVVRKVAVDFDLHATFMPKPLADVNGSGMHTHQSLFQGSRNCFHDPKGRLELSALARHYIGGLLEHARGMCGVTNPLVNSYKRLVPGYEAPTNVAWSEHNRSPLVRVPARRGIGTRVELRLPDPSCNPYLAFAVMLAAGLDGVRRKLDPGEPVNKNVFTMSAREKARLRIDDLPADLSAALRAMKKDALIRETLGEHVFNHFIAAKQASWDEYSATVHPWELQRYLARY
ncbi:MAG TPA: type I glutamate--ammonia ligase [Candidatus Polarisedimenticolaceae bacterium]|nr:type I glutamate--ammonia ligase [Candidatus Polarisedimenticolaceae bacterium]